MSSSTRSRPSTAPGAGSPSARSSGLIFPPSVIGAAAVGGVVGGVGAHLRKGMKRADVKELGELLENGEAGLVVVGESRVAEELDKALARAERTLEKEVDSDADELRRRTRPGREGRHRAVTARASRRRGAPAQQPLDPLGLASRPARSRRRSPTGPRRSARGRR